MVVEIKGAPYIHECDTLLSEIARGAHNDSTNQLRTVAQSVHQRWINCRQRRVLGLYIPCHRQQRALDSSPVPSSRYNYIIPTKTETPTTATTTTGNCWSQNQKLWALSEKYNFRKLVRGLKQRPERTTMQRGSTTRLGTTTTTASDTGFKS